MKEESNNPWVPADTKPENEGAYLCDIGGIDPVVLRFIGGHWYFLGHGDSKKDSWVNSWMECPKQLRT